MYCSCYSNEVKRSLHTSEAVTVSVVNDTGEREYLRFVSLGQDGKQIDESGFDVFIDPGQQIVWSFDPESIIRIVYIQAKDLPRGHTRASCKVVRNASYTVSMIQNHICPQSMTG